MKKFLPFLNVWTVFAVIGATVFTYYFTLQFPFFFDDYISVINNPILREPELALKPRVVTNPNTRFISMLIFAGAYAIDGLNTFYYRIIGLSVHLVNGLLLFYFVKVLFKYLSIKSEIWAGTFASLIFLLHPLQSQAVVYISQNMTVFSTFFYLLSIIIYFNFRTGKIAYSARGWVLISLFFIYLLGIQCKQISGTIPISLLLLEVFIFPIKTRYYSKKWIFLLFLFTSFLIFTYLFFDFTTIETSAYSRFDYLKTQLYVISKYLFLFLWPAKLSIEHQPELITSIFNFNFIIGFVVISTLITVALLSFKNHRVISYAIFFVGVAFSLESSIIPIRDLMFEHRVYLPTIGLSIIGAYLLIKIPKIKLALFISLTSLFIIVTSSKLSVWETDLSLWKNAVKVSPNSARAYTNLGFAYISLDSILPAEKSFKKALEIDENYYQALNNMGLILMKQEKFSEAIHYLQKSITFNPKNKFAYNNIGVCWEQKGAIREALKYYNLALKADPLFIEALINKAVVLENLERYKDALNCYEKVLHQMPQNFKALYNSGNIYLKTQQTQLAVVLYKKAIKINPNSSDAQMNLAISFYNQNQLDSALVYAQNAVQLSPNNHHFQGNLSEILNTLEKKAK